MFAAIHCIHCIHCIPPISYIPYIHCIHTIHYKVKSVEAIAKAVHYGAKAVVLVYESTNAATPDRSLLQYSAELKELIEKVTHIL